MIKEANQKAFSIINQGEPVLTDVVYARDVFTQLPDRTILHAGPPLAWDEMCGPLRGAIIGVCQYEGWAETPEAAEALASSGRINFRPNHSVGAVGPMTGMISPSMPVFMVKNAAFGNVAYSSINEGVGKVMRFGANDQTVLDRLKWLETELAPVLKRAITHAEGVNLKVLIAKALSMGDELHQRNIAASSLLFRQLVPHIAETTEDSRTIARVTGFLSGNEQFFLNLAMASSKCVMDAIRDIPYCTIVSAMSRNGTNFGIRVSGLGDEWFQAPVEMPTGLYFPGYTEADANPDIGDSAIVECVGFGGVAMAAAPAVTQFVGAGGTADAYRITGEMYEIAAGENTQYKLPTINFRGLPSGIDITKVVETGIRPYINSGIAHREPGVGQVGAGTVFPPMACFEQALVAFAERYHYI